LEKDAIEQDRGEAWEEVVARDNGPVKGVAAWAVLRPPVPRDIAFALGAGKSFPMKEAFPVQGANVRNAVPLWSGLESMGYFHPPGRWI